MPFHCVGGDNHEEAYNQVYDDNNPPYDDDNKAKFSHEAVGGMMHLVKRGDWCSVIAIGLVA